DFAAQFQRRRSYGLIPHLPDLFDEASPAAQDLRFDFWRTVAELAEREFARPVHTWCRKHGVSFALEPYRLPPMGFTGPRFCASGPGMERNTAQWLCIPDLAE